VNCPSDFQFQSITSTLNLNRQYWFSNFRQFNCELSFMIHGSDTLVIPHQHSMHRHGCQVCKTGRLYQREVGSRLHIIITDTDNKDNLPGARSESSWWWLRVSWKRLLSDMKFGLGNCYLSDMKFGLGNCYLCISFIMIIILDYSWWCISILCLSFEFPIN
jgi:hypothetical protein